VSQNRDDIDAIGVFDTYWRLYGGWPAILKSLYFWAAVAITFVCYPLWNKETGDERAWTSAAVEIIPSLMSFSLGGMAILLAFSNERLMKSIQQAGRADSLYMQTTASFFHFILLQTLALVGVLLAQAYTVDLFSALAFFLMSYGLTVAVAVAGNLLKLAQIFNLKQGAKDNNDSK